MFNVGPFEMLVLAAVALIVFGPEKLPQLAKDAARMLRTLRDLAQGARSQLNEELGPEFADIDLRSLNPRTAIRNALLGDEELPNLNPREVISRALRGEDEPDQPRSAGAPRSAAAPRSPAAPATSAAPRNSAAPGNSAAPANSAAPGSPAAPSPTAPANSAAPASPAGASGSTDAGFASYQDAGSVLYDPDAT